MSARRIALDALLDVTQRGAYANLRMKQAQRLAATPEDARFIAALVYETLDHLIYLDYVLSAYCKGAQKPVIRGILRMGACELLYLRTPARAACNEGVRLAREVGKGALAGYVNAVLRAVARAMEQASLPALPQSPPALRMSVQYSFPQWLVENWIADYGEEEAERLLATPPPAHMTLRPQPPYTAEALAQELARRGTGFARGRWDANCFVLDAGLDIARDPLFLEGKITAQGEAAMLACRACGVRPGMRVLDACAAPGGKTAYLFALAGGEAALTAWELHPHRKDLLDQTLSRLHVRANTALADAALPAEGLDAAFDVALVDAPCSGLGVAKPDLRYARRPADIRALCETQARILDACAAYVKPGGALVYATCTIHKAENEAQIAAFLARHGEFALESLAPYLPEGIPGRESGMAQLLPWREGTEGFFIARLKRGGV